MHAKRRLLLTAVAVVCAASALSGCGKSCGGCGDDAARLSGRVLDAMSDDGLNGVMVTADGDTAYTDTDGAFAFEGLEPGTVHVETGTDGYYAYGTDIVLECGDDAERDFPLVPESNTWEYRFILWWGEEPTDLDAHLWVPADGLRPLTHVYSGATGSLVAAPYASLVLNDTTGYGPEIMTVRQNNPGGWPVTYYDGEFVFAVRHNAGGSTIPASGAYVEIYHEDDLIETIEAPAGSPQLGWYWYVGTLNCTTGAWTLVNTYSGNPPAM
jgi:hypothetical protein